MTKVDHSVTGYHSNFASRWPTQAPLLEWVTRQICAVEWTYNSLTVMTGYIYDADGNRVAKGAKHNPRGVCPLCLTPIGTPGPGKFECPNCHRLIQTTKAYRALCQIVSFGVGAAICWALDLPWPIKLLLWPVLAFILGIIYYTLVAFVWIPTYREFHPKAKDDEPFQKLGL